MKKTLALIVIALSLSSTAHAIPNEENLEKGWHTGSYFTINAGFVQETDDRHAVTGQDFGTPLNPDVSLTLGWDVRDWIGPYITLGFGWSYGHIGTASGAAGGFPAGTFPAEKVLQTLFDANIGARMTLPYFTTPRFQPDGWRVIPYLKVAGSFHGMSVHANDANNAINTMGGGCALGVGAEFMPWKQLILTVEAIENFNWRKGYTRVIGGTNTTLLTGGFKPFLNFNIGMGWHF